MADKRLRIEFCNIQEGKLFWVTNNGVDMKLKAIEFAQAKIDKQGKVQDIAGQIKKYFDDNFNAHW